MPNLVYPNNVGEIRVSVPFSLKDEALGILAAHRERLAPLAADAFADTPAAFPYPAPLPALPLDADEEEEEEDDEEWDDEDDDGDGDDDDEDGDTDDDLFDDEE